MSLLLLLLGRPKLPPVKRLNIPVVVDQLIAMVVFHLTEVLELKKDRDFSHALAGYDSISKFEPIT